MRTAVAVVDIENSLTELCEMDEWDAESVSDNVNTGTNYIYIYIYIYISIRAPLSFSLLYLPRFSFLPNLLY